MTHFIRTVTVARRFDFEADSSASPRLDPDFSRLITDNKLLLRDQH